MDLFSWDGTLSYKEFAVAAAPTFVHKWERLNSSSPSWIWMEGYLSLDNFCLLPSSHQESLFDANLIQKEVNEEETIDDDDATLVHSNKSYDGAHYYDFHIVYSASYRVPALYFRGYCCDGRPLMLNEIEKDLPSCSAKVLLESKWSFITLEEHPYMNRPWYKLHPCGTSEWMKLLFLSDAVMAKNGLAIDQYLVSWFSVVGQVVGLRTPIKMVKSIHDN
ncbi:hypothetical protein K2173_000552 [Erythroxylum novogranatense]|uniref:Ubiquitin-like-conjugating enzyme ATG10 n=1 Tax=Erythroxylum novogranatense TaxID=1862640 RepID=A0AAV8S7T3_9ROSI|nr:hypothetical protein K2173_000552 [Erythroxylum novogranatense]